MLPPEPVAGEERRDRPDEAVAAGVVVGQVAAFLEWRELPAAGQPKLTAQRVDDEVGRCKVPVRAGAPERG